MIRNFFLEEDGANMVEYALLVALIGVVLVVTISLLTVGIDTTLQRGVAALSSSS